MFSQDSQLSISEKRTDLMRYFQSRAGKGNICEKHCQKDNSFVDTEKANFTIYTGAMGIK